MDIPVHDRWWIRRPWLFIAAIAVTAIGLHGLFLDIPLSPDEGGYLLVAQQWHTDGPYLYGDLWVDRPPLLLIAFAIAGDFGVVGIHVLAGLCAGTVVAAAGWAGSVAAGPAAGRWSALTAGALSTSVLIGAQALDGELLAIPFVMSACALMLHAWHRASRGQYLYVGMAGVVAASAALMKQNFVEGMVFAIVFFGAQIVRHQDRRRAARMLVAFLIGVSVVLSLVAGWAISQGHLGELWFATYEFRVEAAAVIRAGSWHAPGKRLLILIGLAVASGILGLSVLAAFAHRAAFRRGDPLAWALAAGFGIEVLGVALGGSFWSHYLLGVIPMLSLAVGTGIAYGSVISARVLSRLVILTAATSVVAALFSAATGLFLVRDTDRLGEWLANSSRGDDTAVMTYARPNVLARSGLSTPYPYIWSLPARTLDPQLTLLRQTIIGPKAPTWIIQWDRFNTWKLDPHGELARTVASRYRVVAQVCGHRVWLRNGVTREIQPPPACEQ